MPADKNYFLSGKVKWFRPEKANEWGKWEHVLYPDQKSLDLIRELQTSTEKVQGIKNVLRKDDDGYCIRITRPTQKIMRGKMVGFSPPEVIDKEGKPMRNILVGNGSDITTKVEVYMHSTPSGGKARAMRWEGSRIDTLVPYEKKDFTEEEAEQLKGLPEAPVQEEIGW